MDYEEPIFFKNFVGNVTAEFNSDKISVLRILIWLVKLAYFPLQGLGDNFILLREFECYL